MSHISKITVKVKNKFLHFSTHIFHDADINIEKQVSLFANRNFLDTLPRLGLSISIRRHIYIYIYIIYVSYFKSAFYQSYVNEHVVFLRGISLLLLLLIYLSNIAIVSRSYGH